MPFVQSVRQNAPFVAVILSIALMTVALLVALVAVLARM